MNDSESHELPHASTQERDQEATLNTSRRSTVRRMVLFSALAAVAALWGLDRYQQRSLEVNAAALVQEAMQENSAPALDVASRLTVSRDALLFGTPRAKVEVFLRDTGDIQGTRIRGIEYQYTLENGHWRLEDSGSCTSKECALRGREAFDQR